MASLCLGLNIKGRSHMKQMNPTSYFRFKKKARKQELCPATGRAREGLSAWGKGDFKKGKTFSPMRK